MATVLPSINPGGSSKFTSHSPIVHHNVPSKHSGPSPSAESVVLQVQKRRSQGKKERELEQRKAALRALQNDLTKKDTAQFRHSYKHNLCLDMLQEGFHKSFAELFALIKQQNEERLRAGPESILWNQTLLENEPEKLDKLKFMLTSAEEGLRREEYGHVYQCQFELARYFQGQNDKWLADHFFASCLATSTGVQGDEGKMAAEGHCNVGLALEENGEYHEAAANFEQFYGLARNHGEWELKDGVNMQGTSCTNLSRIYTTISSQHQEAGDLQQYLGYLQKAYNMAKESGDRKLEGEASYRLGLAFERNGDSETALLYLNNYLDRCQVTNDHDGVGRACQAIAKSYQSQGKVEESIKYLEMFVDVAEKSKDDRAISRACSDLGAMFNTLGRYEQAVEYFNKSYNIARAMNDTETISSSRVQFGIAAAHKVLAHYSVHTELGNKPCIDRMLEWKDNRGDEFDKPIPEPSAETETADNAEDSDSSDKEQTQEDEETTEEQEEPQGEDASNEEQPKEQETTEQTEAE